MEDSNHSQKKSQQNSAKVEPIEIVDLTSSYAQQISDLDALCNRPPWSANLISQEFCLPYCQIKGVIKDEKLIAFLVLHFIFEEVRILNFGVHPDYRGRKIGRRLISDVLDYGLKNKARTATLEVRKSNQRAINLYESLGFTTRGVRPGYYPDDREDGLVMTLDY